MDISVKVTSGETPQLRISATVSCSAEAAHLINVIKVNADSIFDEEIVFKDEDE